MSAPSQSTAALVQYVQSRLIVRQLQTVLKAFGLPSSGVKKTLQERLIDRIHELSRNNEIDALDKLRNVIYNPDTLVPGSTAPPVIGRSNGYSSSPTANGDYKPFYNPPNPYGASVQGIGRIHFKSSPLYHILENLSATQTIPVMSQNRNTVVASFTLNQQQIDTLAAKNMKAMLFCGPLDNPALSQLAKVEIGFPQQVEVKVNGQAVPPNQLRGLKNKPNSTRPPDITHLLVKVPGHKNEVSITYALTQKKYALMVNLVNQVPIEKLVQDLRSNSNKISKQTVIDDMVKRNQESELVATSSVMSLKCPLSTLRIVTPVRSKICTHVQCFDAASFLQLQQQAPTWTCPTCSKPVPFEMLVVDSYVQDILDSTPKTVDSVTVDPNGNWSVASQRSPSPEMSPNSDEDEDIIEIRDSNPPRKPGMTETASPHPSSREATAPRSASKRPISNVIDLTLSDDDEPLHRAAKRPALNNNNQLHTPSSLSSLEGRPFHRSPITFALNPTPSSTLSDSVSR